MMDLRKRIFIILSAVIGVILALLLWYLFVFNQEEVKEEGAAPAAGQATTGAGAGVSPQSPEATAQPVASLSSEEQAEIYLKQLSKIFVERYGSYSNQNDNQHLLDVLPLATAKMGGWIRTQQIAQSLDYQGLTTRVIASSVKEFNEQQAKVAVDVQQEKQTKDTVEMIYKTGTVNLVKSNGEWKVDGLYWEE